MMSQWREERETRNNSSSSRGREGGADEENNSCNNGSGGQQEGDRQQEQDCEERSQGTATDSESEAQFREALRKEKQRKRKRSGNGGGDGDDIETVSGNIPVDLLRRMSPLCEKLGISMRQQLSLTMGFVELCGELKRNIEFQCDIFLHRSGLYYPGDESFYSMA